MKIPDYSVLQYIESLLLNNATLTQPTSTPFFSQAAYCLSWCLPFLLLISRTTADLSLVVVDLLFLSKCYYNKEWGWLKFNWVKCSLLFFAYIVLVNVPLSLQPLSSLSYAIFFLRWPVFAVAVSEWLTKSEQHFRHSLIAFALTISFIVLDTWYQYFVGHDLFGYTLYPDQRLTGPFNKPFVGIMLVRVLFLVLFATLVFDYFKSTQKKLIFTMMALPVGLLTIFVSGERMAFILGFSGFITMLFGFWMQHRNMRLRISVGFLMFLFFLVLACVLNPSVSERMVHNLVEKLIHFTSSDYGVVFNAAWRAWQENWWFGSGLHTYKQHCESLHLLANTGFDCTHAHNLYLQIGTETGLIGLIFFTTMIIAIFLHGLSDSIRQRHWFDSALVFSILNLSFWPLIGGISILNNWVASLTWLGVGWSLAIKKIRYQQALVNKFDK